MLEWFGKDCGLPKRYQAPLVDIRGQGQHRIIIQICSETFSESLVTTFGSQIYLQVVSVTPKVWKFDWNIL